MFRNPRENANPTTTTPLKPSTGRAPTPLGEFTPLPKSAIMATRTSSTKPLTPKPASKSNAGSIPAKGKGGGSVGKKAFSAKIPGKANASILNFFKKVDSPIKDESIFVAEKRGFAGMVETTTSMPDLLDDELYDDQDEDAGRFNEIMGSVKRRKTSRTSSPSGSGKDGDEVGDGLEQEGAEATPMVRTTECSPPPQEPEDVSVQPRPKRTGPFLSDSESEDEEENAAIQEVAVNAEKMELDVEVLNQPEDMNEMVETKSIDRDQVYENKPIIPQVDHVQPAGGEKRMKVPIAKAQAKWEAMQPNTPSDDDEDEGSEYGDEKEPQKKVKKTKKVPKVPKLEKESTRVDEWGKFDDIEDFPDYDEFGDEGEERKWMEEQVALEGSEFGDDGEVFNGFDDEPLDQPPDEESSSTCPICGASLKGINDDLASRHVNGCLDGNSVPLPELAPKKEETSDVKIMLADAKKRFARKATVPRAGQANPINIGSSEVKGTSAFSKLMSGHAEDAAWAAASAAEHSSRGKPAYQRICPFYKIMPGFFICVDAFRYGAVQGCNAYFLSHFHSDHYIGLTSSWCHGPIYCSKVTANLVKQQLRVDPKWVKPLEFEGRFEVPGTKGVEVTMIPANHCPGSSLFLYEKVIGKGKVQRVLHCGDFRACPTHIAHPLLMPNLVDSITGKTKQQKIDVCYLDTTYLNPRYAFPSQEEVIKACADMCVSLKKERAEESDAWEVVKKERAGSGMTKFVSASIKAEDDSIAMSLASSVKNAKSRGRLLVVCGTYSIGKERICMGIARALDCKIWCPPGKMKICKALEDPELMSRMTDDPREAQIHMQMLMEIRAETLQEYLNSYKPYFSRIVGFRPSGWNYRPPNSRYVSISQSRISYITN